MDNLPLTPPIAPMQPRQSQIRYLPAIGITLACLLCKASLLASVADAQVPVQSSQPAIDFERDIAPIFDQHCTQCHGPSKQTADLRLDLRSAILKGASSGPILDIQHTEKSRLIQVITGQDPDYQMPPEGERLSEEQIDKIRVWIQQGAAGPDDSKRLEKPLPWSFRPIEDPWPQASDSSGQFPGLGPIDQWIQAQLDQKQLHLSETAERPTLIRRLFLVALGVPPTPEEVSTFCNDESFDAYEKLVDRTLADPRYGERLARHWFDVIRFAESNGFETNRVRYNAWPFRDFVIQALNQDMPYSEFVKKQIAGDALGEDLATGFLVAGTYDIVKSPDVNLTLMQRQDELADLINTTGTAFLGLTLGCARCHDHKFDPISQKDFYSLQAIYAGVNFGDRNLPSDSTPEKTQRLTQIANEVRSLQKEIEKIEAKAQALAQSKNLRPAVSAKLNEESFETILAKSVRLTILASGNSQPCIDEWEVFDTQDNNVALASTGSTAKASGCLEGYAIHKIEHINDGKTGNSNSWISNQSDAGWIQIDFKEPKPITRMRWGRDRSEQYKDRTPTRYTIEALVESDQWKPIASHVGRMTLAAQGSDGLVELLDPDQRSQHQAFKEKSKSLISEEKTLTQGSSVWLGTFSAPPTIHRLYRGDPLMKREVVSPALVAALDGQEFAEDTPEQSRRVALANWIGDPKNPLTPRVIANRLWQFTFGTGIVDTPSDFGANGTLPTHPELLDWLSQRLIEHDWSLKNLHRSMLTSQAFRQSSKPNPQGLSIDADSRLLWRFPPRRLEAEAIRDSMLIASGVIDYRMGGPGFYLQRVEQDNVYRYFPKEKVGPAEYRRMVYLTRIRQEQDPVFGAFDCPSGNQVVPKRPRSNTPLQSLNLFNSPFVMQQAELFAERLNRLANSDMDQQVRMSFHILFARDPDAQEIELSKEMIRDQGLVQYCRAILNASEFLFIF
jgi:mono/diheme cytochrome c family protein